jgi:hypothetical protein
MYCSIALLRSVHADARLQPAIEKSHHAVHPRDKDGSDDGAGRHPCGARHGRDSATLAQ